MSGVLWISLGVVFSAGVKTPSVGDIGLMERWVLFFDPGLSVESILTRVHKTE